MTISISRLEKKARDATSGISSERAANYKNLTERQKAEQKINGVFGNKRMQAMVKREDLASEVVLGRGVDNNAFIVIGNDRVSKPHTGYGGKGHTQCDSIDIVCGTGGSNPKEVDSDDNVLHTNPNFFIDSARIYISQKTDVDKNFGIGEFGNTSKEKSGVTTDDTNDKNAGKYGAKSAVVAKADNIRIIGRESIRIVTGTDASNSQGGEVLSQSGIEIVAMNNIETLQPMVLGENLISFLEEVLKKISSLSETFHAFSKYQMKMNQATANHVHHSPFYGIPTTTAPVAMAAGAQADIEYVINTELSILKSLTNLNGLRTNYLIESGDSFVLSRLNKVN